MDYRDRRSMWCVILTVSFQGNCMNRHVAFDADELHAMEGDPELVHAEVHIVDGDLVGGCLGQDENVKHLARTKGHSSEAFLSTPNLTRQVVTHNAILSGTNAKVQCNVITRSRHTACLQVYHESRTIREMIKTGNHNCVGGCGLIS